MNKLYFGVFLLPQVQACSLNFMPNPTPQLLDFMSIPFAFNHIVSLPHILCIFKLIHSTKTQLKSLITTESFNFDLVVSSVYQYLLSPKY